ncbi:MAG: hypothetical protein AAGH43_13565 [Pseudomonadota bacterium]
MRLAHALLLAALATPAFAQSSVGPMSGEITAACMQAMEESETVCACVEDDALSTLTADQQTFLLALLTEDEALVRTLDGFTEADAQMVQNQMINAALQCAG